MSDLNREDFTRKEWKAEWSKRYAKTGAKNVKNIDTSYNKREGVSWLQDYNLSANENIKSHFEDYLNPSKKREEIIIPKVPQVPEDEEPLYKKPSAIISKDDKQWFTDEGWYPTAGRQGKGWTAEATVKEDKVDDFMSMAFDPDNFENGKLKEDSEIYKLINRAKEGGSRRMYHVENQLKRYAQGIKNLGALKKEGFDPPSWANKLVNEVQWLLTTKKRRK